MALPRGLATFLAALGTLGTQRSPGCRQQTFGSAGRASLLRQCHAGKETLRRQFELESRRPLP